MDRINTESTHAIVVGIDKYDAGDTWNLSGPVDDALRFTEWLTSMGIAARNIRLLLSPLDKSIDFYKDKAGYVDEAKQENIRRIITEDLASLRNGDLLYVFWGGHGMITRDQEHYLYYANTTQNDPAYLKIENLLAYFRSDAVKSFRRQIFFFDACANNPGMDNIPPPQGFRTGNILDREQYVLFAAQLGHFAVNLSEERTGLFSKALLEILRKEEHSNPLDMEMIAKQLTQRFVRLRQEGKTTQTPTVFNRRNWQGEEDSFNSMASSLSSIKTRLINEIEPPVLFRIVDALLQCPSISDAANRGIIIQQLSYSKYLRRDEHYPRNDVFLLVQTSLNYPGGLRELFQLIEIWDGKTARTTQNLSKSIYGLPDDI